MGPLFIISVFAFLLAVAGGWIVVRGELRAVPVLGEGRVPLKPSGRPVIGPRLVFATLQTMLALWAIGSVGGFLIFGLPEATQGTGLEPTVDVFRRATAATIFLFVPFSLLTLMFAVRSLRQHEDDGKGVAPMIAAAFYLVALLMLYVSPWFWKG